MCRLRFAIPVSRLAMSTSKWTRTESPTAAGSTVTRPESLFVRPSKLSTDAFETNATLQSPPGRTTNSAAGAGPAATRRPAATSSIRFMMSPSRRGDGSVEQVELEHRFVEIVAGIRDPVLERGAALQELEGEIGLRHHEESATPARLGPGRVLLVGIVEVVRALEVEPLVQPQGQLVRGHEAARHRAALRIASQQVGLADPV